MHILTILPFLFCRIMEQHLKDGTEVLMVNIGMMYAAPNEHTGGWSRVRVTDIPISGCSVFYVDHGYYGKALKLKNLVPYCLTHPEIAKMCFLQPVPPPEDRERIKALLTAGVEIEVDGLRLGNTAQSVTVCIGGRTLQEILHQEDEKSESASVTNSDKETELRPEAVDFVPTRNWDAIGCRLVSKYVKRCEDDESKDICESLGSLLKKASEADALTQKGKNFLKVRQLCDKVIETDE
jgi:Tudor domain